MLLRILHWIVTISRPEFSQLVTSLNRFGACPRETHLDLTVRALGYVKMTLHTVILIDSVPMKLKRSSPNFPTLIIEFLKNDPDAKEDLDPGLPSSFRPI